MISMILSALSAIGTATSIIQAAADRQETRDAIRQVERQVVAVREEVDRHRESHSTDESLNTAYQALLIALRQSRAYASHLEFRRTSRGTYVLLVKRPIQVQARTTMLRDPKGEF